MAKEKDGTALRRLVITEEGTERGSSKSATLLLFLDTPAAIILLHPVKVVPKVWYLVGIGLIEALLHLKTATDFFCLVGARGLCINCVTAFRVSSSAAGLFPRPTPLD